MTSYTRRYAGAFSIAIALFGLDVNSTIADVYTTPVGFVNTTVTNVLAGGGFTAVGQPLQPMKNDQGLISAVSSNVITVACSTCSTSNYGNPNALNYVEFATGQGVGRFFSVQTNTSTTITLAVGTENLTALSSGGSVQAGDRYIVRPFWTLTSLFGPANASPLKAASNQSTADNILIFDDIAQGYITFFPRISGGATNWFQVGVGINNNFPILPDEAVFVKRAGSGLATNIVLVGEVKTTNSTTVLQQGFNFVANAFPAGVTLSNSQLLASGFRSGANQSSADVILLWDQANQGYQTVFSRISAGTTNWFMVGVGFTNNLVLDIGQGYFLNTKVSGYYWNRPLPYTP